MRQKFESVLFKHILMIDLLTITWEAKPSKWSFQNALVSNAYIKQPIWSGFNELNFTMFDQA